MKRLLRWTGMALAVPPLLFLLLAFLLYLPPVQDFAVREASRRLSEATGFHAAVGRLRVRFPLDVDLQELLVADVSGDTIVAAASVVVDLDMSRLMAMRLGVDAIALRGVRADTRRLISTTRIAGNFEALTVADGIDLRSRHVTIDDVTLHKADVTIVLRDTTTAPDTTSTVVPWTIDVRRATVADSRLHLAMEAAATAIEASLPRLCATDGHIDLLHGRYSVLAFDGAAADFALAQGGSRPLTYDSLTLSADSIAFDVESMHLAVATLGLRTPSSRVKGAVAMDISAFTPAAGGRLSAHVDADVGRGDVAWALALADSLAMAPLASAWPDVPVHVALCADGNVDTMRVTTLDVRLPATIDMEATAVATSVLDSVARGCELRFNVRSGDASWLLSAMGADMRSLRLPPMTLVGEARAHGNSAMLRSRLHEGGAAIELQGEVTIPAAGTRAATYAARADIRSLDVRHFLPRDSIGIVSATIDISGTGTDIYAPTTSLQADADISRLQYGRRYDLGGIGLQATLHQGLGRATLSSDNDLLRCRADIGAKLERRISGLTFGLDLTSADLHALGITDHPLRVAACFHIDGTTNLADSHAIDGTIDDITLHTADTIFRPEDITLRALLQPDTVYAYISSGDLAVMVETDKGYDRLLSQTHRLANELQSQWQARRFSLNSLRQQLPMAQLHVSSGTHNPLHAILRTNGFGFDTANIDITLSPIDGFNSGGQLYRAAAESIQLDTIAFYAFQDTTGIGLEARVRNGKGNPQFRFDARLSAQLTDTGSVARLLYLDERGRTGVDLSMRAAIEDDALRLTLDPLQPVIAYRRFQANADNHFCLLRRNRVDADLRLLGDDGTGINIYTTPNDAARQDITLALQRINLGEIVSVVPYAPRLTGFLDGDLHFVQHDSNVTLSADVTASDLVYESAPLGQVGLQAVYLPNADGSHFIDGSLLHTGLPVASVSGTLGKATHDGVMALNADVTLDAFPLSLANGFIPKGDAAGRVHMAQLGGFLLGSMHIGGNSRRPDVGGTLHTSDVTIRSDLYSLDLRMPDSDIAINRSRLALDSLRLFATGATPLMFTGGIDFADLGRIAIDVDVTAKDFELINARKTATSVAYGKVFVDCNARVRGTMDNLSVMGSLSVLPATDATYVLADSPLSAEDQLAGLVEFVDFTDTVRIDTPPAAARPKHLTLFMNIQIANAAQFHCLLSPDGSNYVDLEGGGTLSLAYTPDRNLQLNGRYTINSGTLKYTMMVIPLKEFAIKSGSYVEFRGPVANPHLNLTATERMRTTLTENGQPRSVFFDVGLAITQTLDNMGLEFTLEAPEDMLVQNEIATMSTEQRGRVAVTMLATGMYITDNSSSTTGGFSGQNALNAFLQSQISNIAGKALKSVDISMGVDQGTSTTGATTTDYSFRFAKRFWGNRISVIVGGRVSTGEDAVNSGASIIDNVSIEYRLDKSATRYVNLFYHKNTQSLLDGEVMEMGAGLVLRRKTHRLGELFLFRSSKE